MTGGFGPSCDRGDGGSDGSSGSSSRPLRPPQLPSPLAFALEPERGAGGGIGGDCSFGVLKGATQKSVYHQKTVSWEHFFRLVATQHNSWEVYFTHRSELLHDPQEPSHPQRFLGPLFHHSKRATPAIRITLFDPSIGPSTAMVRKGFSKGSWQI